MTRQIFALLGLFLITAQGAFAAEYKINITGTVVNESSVPTIFGDSRSSYPVGMSFKIESTAAQLVPAGTVFDTDNGYKIIVDSYLIPRSAISEFSAQVGSAAFETADLINQSLGSAGDYDVLITGSLSNPDGVFFILNDALFGDVSVGTLFCPTTECSIFPVGAVFSIQDSGFGSITGLEGTSEEVVVAPPTSMEQTQALITQINAMALTPAQGKAIYTQALRIQDSLRKGKLVSADLHADNLLKLIAKAVKTKGLTLAQATALTSSVEAIRTSLQ